MELFDPQGRRLYLSAKERGTFIEATNNAESEGRTFCLVLAYTGFWPKPPIFCTTGGGGLMPSIYRNKSDGYRHERKAIFVFRPELRTDTGLIRAEISSMLARSLIAASLS